jgi:GntR family transcriptional repressor for pyruvate dehydrogenase complex
MADSGQGLDGSPDDTWAAVEPVRRLTAESGETLPEQIADRIEELIGTGRLSPGDRLPSERELARVFGVNRLAVREAAQRLEALGLVVVRRGAGAFVARPSASESEPPEPPLPKRVDIEELFEVRRLIEPAAAEYAARRADRSALAALLRAAEQFEANASMPEKHFDVIAASDVRLHLDIAYCADNAVLGRMVERLQDLHLAQLEWSLRRLGRLDETVSEHRRLVEAIAAREPDAAREAMLAHLAAAATSFRVVAERTDTLD